MIALLSACFGALATLLAALGLYGVMSYSVAARTREIGIRMALGADRGSVLQLVMRDVLLLAGVGIGLGVPGAIGLGRFVASQLFGLTPNDPATLVAASVLLALVAAAAGLVPARRATRVEPMKALHYQ
jgi:ABC-type antimicrobial peptide transport system permease subunit